MSLHSRDSSLRVGRSSYNLQQTNSLNMKEKLKINFFSKLIKNSDLINKSLVS